MASDHNNDVSKPHVSVIHCPICNSRTREDLLQRHLNWHRSHQGENNFHTYKDHKPGRQTEYTRSQGTLHKTLKVGVSPEPNLSIRPYLEGQNINNAEISHHSGESNDIVRLYTDSSGRVVDENHLLEDIFTGDHREPHAAQAKIDKSAKSTFEIIQKMSGGWVSRSGIRCKICNKKIRGSMLDHIRTKHPEMAPRNKISEKPAKQQNPHSDVPDSSKK